MSKVIWQENGKQQSQRYTKDDAAMIFARRLVGEGFACGVNTNDGKMVCCGPEKEPQVFASQRPLPNARNYSPNWKW